MRFYKLISVLFHPIVLPTITVILYFLIIPSRFNSEQQLSILGLVFIATYIIPVLILVILKAFKQINSYQLITIKERKFPLIFIIILYYLVGNTLFRISQIRDIGLLFYTLSLCLIIVYVLYIFKKKISIHLLFAGTIISFFLLLSLNYSTIILPVVIVLILLSGIIATSRLLLKTNQPYEVYIGFFIGLICPFLVNGML